MKEQGRQISEGMQWNRTHTTFSLPGTKNLKGSFLSHLTLSFSFHNNIQNPSTSPQPTDDLTIEKNIYLICTHTKVHTISWKMIGIINKLLYILTLSPFEKVPLSSAPPLDGPNGDDQITFLQLREKNHEGRLLGLNENHLLDFFGEKLSGRYRRSDDNNIPVAQLTSDDLSVEEKEKLKKAEIEQREKYANQTRIVRFGIWTYLLYAVSILWFFGDVRGSETLVVYMRRIVVLMAIAATVDVIKSFMDIQNDPYMKWALDGLLLVVGVAATGQLIWAIPQFYYELSKSVFKK